MLPFAHAQLGLECGQQCRDEHVLQNAEVSLDGGPGDGGIAGRTRDVDHLTVNDAATGRNHRNAGRLRTSASIRISSRTYNCT